MNDDRRKQTRERKQTRQRNKHRRTEVASDVWLRNCMAFGSVHYEEQWVHDQSVIEATVDLWKRDGATEIVQSEYLFKNGKIRYMVACG